MASLSGEGEAKPPRQQHIEAVDPQDFTNAMEQLQRGYMSSVAATAGLTFSVKDRDAWGIDAEIVRLPRTASELESTLFVQMKSTTQTVPDPTKGFFSYQFTKRQYFDHMVKIRSYPKAILVVMTMSPKQLEWTEADHAGLLTKRCCYWVFLEGTIAKPGVERPTVRIPTKNVLDANSLIEILEKTDRGESLHE